MRSNAMLWKRASARSSSWRRDGQLGQKRTGPLLKQRPASPRGRTLESMHRIVSPRTGFVDGFVTGGVTSHSRTRVFVGAGSIDVQKGCVSKRRTSRGGMIHFFEFLRLILFIVVFLLTKIVHVSKSKCQNKTFTEGRAVCLAVYMFHAPTVVLRLGKLL